MSKNIPWTYIKKKKTGEWKYSYMFLAKIKDFCYVSTIFNESVLKQIFQLINYLQIPFTRNQSYCILFLNTLISPSSMKNANQ